MTSATEESGSPAEAQPPSLRCRIGWHSYRRTTRVNQADHWLYVCNRCGATTWRP